MTAASPPGSGRPVLGSDRAAVSADPAQGSGEPWPTASRYVAVVQDPASMGPSVPAGRPRPGLLGLPQATAGQHAVVFPIDGGETPRALRCFTAAPDDATRHRYRLLAEHVARHPVPLAPVAWHDRGIWVDQRWWPVVTMPWLPGSTLDVAVAERVGDPVALGRLADAFVALADDLATTGVAHGDLQHANLLVEGDDRLHLVDYDGTWVPGAEALAPTQVGHRSYQHPARLADGGWGRWVDVVPGLVIHLSLVAVAAQPALWARYHDGENLLLHEADLVDPPASELLNELLAAPDPAVAIAARRLAGALAAPPDAHPTLAHALAGDGYRPPEVPGARPAWAVAPDDPPPASDPEMAAAAPSSLAATAPVPAAAEYAFSPHARRWSWRRRR